MLSWNQNKNYQQRTRLYQHSIGQKVVSARKDEESGPVTGILSQFFHWVRSVDTAGCYAGEKDKGEKTSHREQEI